MLDVGFSEILLTSAIALVVLGPERLPKVARQVGNWMGRARAMARQLSEQLEREVNADELLKAQSKTKPGTSVPAIGAAPPASAAIAPAPVSAAPPATASPPVTAAAPVAAAPPATTPVPMAAAADTPQVIDEIPPAPREPEPVFGGLPPSATTPAAMHASEPHLAESKSAHE
jgi:sec-independent protein translocase protein TatB